MYGVNSRFTALRELGHRLTDPLADITTAICQTAADSYVQSRSVPASKIVALPNGLDTHEYRPRPEVRERMRAELGVKGFTWLAVGRLESPKNYPLMLEAFARNGDDSSTLLICGAGSLESEVRARVLRLGLDHRVRLLGMRRDIPSVMNAADGFLLSSDTEGLPMVLLQAAASGLPVAATHVGGNAEVVEHGVTGFLTPPGKAGPLAAAIQRVATGLSETQRKAMGHAARELAVSRYDLQVIADRWEQLYFRLLALPTSHRKGTSEPHVGDHRTNPYWLRN
jgi:glycosyltransferase involved in cell wall biosynthesis